MPDRVHPRVPDACPHHFNHEKKRILLILTHCRDLAVYRP
jgi:hypothetical protein